MKTNESPIPSGNCESRPCQAGVILKKSLKTLEKLSNFHFFLSTLNIKKGCAWGCIWTLFCVSRKRYFLPFSVWVNAVRKAAGKYSRPSQVCYPSEGNLSRLKWQKKSYQSSWSGWIIRSIKGFQVQQELFFHLILIPKVIIRDYYYT